LATRQKTRRRADFEFSALNPGPTRRTAIWHVEKKSSGLNGKLARPKKIQRADFEIDASTENLAR